MRKLTTIFIYSSFLFVLLSYSLLAADCKKPTMPSDEDWKSWIKQIKIMALQEGISQNTINKELNNV